MLKSRGKVSKFKFNNLRKDVPLKQSKIEFSAAKQQSRVVLKRNTKFGIEVDSSSPSKPNCSLQHPSSAENIYSWKQFSEEASFASSGVSAAKMELIDNNICRLVMCPSTEAEKNEVAPSELTEDMKQHLSVDSQGYFMLKESQ